MKIGMYAIRDSALDAFKSPFGAHTDAAAARAFGDEINRAGSEGNQHPDDYDLYYLGIFDDNTGRYTDANDHGPRLVVRGKDVHKQPDIFAAVRERHAQAS